MNYELLISIQKHLNTFIFNGIKVIRVNTKIGHSIKLTAAQFISYSYFPPTDTMS